LEEVWEIMLKIRFGLPDRFFFSVMIPLNLVHSDGFSSSASFFSVYHFKGMFCIGQVWVDFDDLGIDDLGRNLNTLPELEYMEDIMDGR
jgi:hypothetical protein